MLEPSGVTLEQLRENPGGVRTPVEPRYKRYAARGANAVGFATPSRRVEIFSAQLQQLGQAPLPEYVEPAASPVSRPDLAARFPCSSPPPRSCSSATASTGACRACGATAPTRRSSCIRTAAQARGITATTGC